MQNAECRMQNGGSLRYEIIRFNVGEETSFYPPI